MDEETGRYTMNICPQCKESIKEGAVKCPHCHTNLFYQEHPNTFMGALCGGIVGFAIVYFQIQGHHDFNALLTAIIGGFFYTFIGGFIGGVIGFIIDATGLRKINFEIPANKYTIGIVVIGAIFILSMSFVPSCGKYISSLGKERRAYNKRVEKTMRKEPKSAEDYKDRGDVALTQGNTKQAIAEYARAIEINPNDGESYNNRAIMHFDTKEYDKAWADVRKAQALGYDVSPKLIEDLNRESAQLPGYSDMEVKEVKVKLDGVLVDASGRSSAIINNKIVFEGDVIDGIKIDKINKDSVDIVVNGQKKNIMVK